MEYLQTQLGAWEFSWDPFCLQFGRCFLEAGVCNEKLLSSVIPEAHGQAAGREHSWPIAQYKSQQYFFHTDFFAWMVP